MLSVGKKKSGMLGYWIKEMDEQQREKWAGGTTVKLIKMEGLHRVEH